MISRGRGNTPFIDLKSHERSGMPISTQLSDAIKGQLSRAVRMLPADDIINLEMATAHNVCDYGDDKESKLAAAQQALKVQGQQLAEVKKLLKEAGVETE
jgi:hypothetical protein